MTADYIRNAVKRAIARSGAFLLLWLLAAWFIADYTVLSRTNLRIQQESASLDRLVDSTAHAIDLSLDYLHGIPTLIARDAQVAAALKRFGSERHSPLPPERRQALWTEQPQLRAVNDYLGWVSKSLSADVVWIVDAAGDCIASSNAGTPDSFVGTDYSDREYFQAGRQGNTGNQFAVGRKTNIPGLFFSTPIHLNGRFAGVAVVKIDIGKLSHWLNQADAFISDEHGIVILTHDPALEMRALPGSDVGLLNAAERLARYKRTDFSPLEIEPWNAGHFPSLYHFGHEPLPFLISQKSINDEKLEISAIRLIPAAAEFARERMQLFLLIGALGALVLLLIAGARLVANIRRHSLLRSAQSASLLRAAIESTIDGILVVDLKRRVTAYNRRFVEIWRIPQRVIDSDDDRKVLECALDQVENREAFAAKLDELYNQPELDSFDIFRLRNGTWIERYSSPQRLGEQIVGRVWSFRDVTERKRAEEVLRESRDELESRVNERTADLKLANSALRTEQARQQQLIQQLAEAHHQLLQSEKMASIGQLAAGVAHEINNPIGFVNSNMATLQGYVADLMTLLSSYEQCESTLGAAKQAQLAELKQKIDLAYLRDDIGKLLEESIGGLQRVKRIVLDLKDFSHVGESTKQWANIEKGLDSTLNVVWNELKYKSEVVKEYGGIPDIECIPTQVNQVFLNLLMNAVQAIETHGKITIRTGQEDEHIWVEVEDTGCGIPPENLDRIFDPFFTTKPVGKGTGLGLSLSYSIVQKHHGRIEVRSEVGKGTTFRVVLPIKSSAEATEEAAATVK